jgi:hypothetical protein
VVIPGAAFISHTDAILVQSPRLASPDCSGYNRFGRASAVQTIIPFVPITVIYAIASIIAISRRNGEKTRSEGFRRWRRMHLWIAGAFIAAFMLAYIEWKMPYPTPDLMTLVGHWLFRCLIMVCVIAALVGYLKRRAMRRDARRHH